MPSFSSNAILTKAKAMYAKRLTEENYEDLMKKKNIDEVVSYLKSETAYSDILSNVKENNIHRDQLEALLNEDAFTRLSKLIHYASKKDLDFYHLGMIEIEMQLIITKVKMIASGDLSTKEIMIPSYLVKYASFHLYSLLSVQDYPSLLVLMHGTVYEPVLKKYQSVKQDKIPINQLEREFRNLYNDLYIETIKKKFKGKRRKDLLTMQYTSIELENITKIYRLKKYFQASPEVIRENINLKYSRIPASSLNEMIEAKDASEFLKKLASSPYKLYVDDKEFVYIEYYTTSIRYHLAKRYMRFSNDAALVYMTYKIVHQIEIENLIHIIEGLRYGESPSQMKEMIIY